MKWQKSTIINCPTWHMEYSDRRSLCYRAAVLNLPIHWALWRIHLAV